jgi:hypothetical protein
MLNGRNPLLTVEGNLRRMGFYQTVFVEAADPHQAEVEVVSIVKSNPDLREAAIRDESIQPSLHLSEMWEIQLSDVPSCGNLKPMDRVYHRQTAAKLMVGFSTRGAQMLGVASVGKLVSSLHFWPTDVRWLDRRPVKHRRNVFDLPGKSK